MQFKRAIDDGSQLYLAVVREAPQQQSESKSDISDDAANIVRMCSLNKLPDGLPPKREVDHRIEPEPGHIPPADQLID